MRNAAPGGAPHILKSQINYKEPAPVCQSPPDVGRGLRRKTRGTLRLLQLVREGEELAHRQLCGTCVKAPPHLGGRAAVYDTARDERIIVPLRPVALRSLRPAGGSRAGPAGPAFLTNVTSNYITFSGQKQPRWGHSEFLVDRDLDFLYNGAVANYGGIGRR